MACLVFKKGTGKHDHLEVVRAGVVKGRIECPKQGIIPHDMVHFAVESTLHRRGFVGRVLEGEAPTFQMEPEAESDGVERLVEVFQADGWSGWGAPSTDLLDLYQLTCAACGCEPLAVSEVDVEAVRACILDLTARWQAVPMGGFLTLGLEHGCDGPP